MVAKPSPPEICWHLMRPPAGFAAASAGSLGCEGVAVGHCTLKLCAATGSAHKTRHAAAIPLPKKRVLSIKPPSGTFRACGAHNHGVGKSGALCATPAAGRQASSADMATWLIVLSWSILSCSRVAGPYVAPTWRLVVIPGGPVIACCPLATKTEPIGTPHTE